LHPERIVGNSAGIRFRAPAQAGGSMPIRSFTADRIRCLQHICDSHYAGADALRLWFERLAHYGRIKHGLAHVLHAAMNDGVLRDTYGPMVGAIDLLRRACEASGSIRKGVDAEDVLLLMGFRFRIEPGRDGRRTG
jgi:hypothetical protein